MSVNPLDSETAKTKRCRSVWRLSGCTNGGVSPRALMRRQTVDVIPIIKELSAIHYSLLTCCWMDYRKGSHDCRWDQSESWRGRRSSWTLAAWTNSGVDQWWQRGQVILDSRSDPDRRFESSSLGPNSRWAHLENRRARGQESVETVKGGGGFGDLDV